VALKVLAPELATKGAARARFAREARAAAAVVHEHVVAIHAVEETRGLPYLVMSYVPGKSLQDRLDCDGPLDVPDVLRIGMQTALGLAAAHDLGLVHRDVKPSNILLEQGVEKVKLTDFGLARAVDDASVTQSGVVAGTPQYMAPEQAGGEHVDHRADLFSLGSVLYAMCAGHPPFRAATTMAVLRRVCDQEPRPLREVNAAVPAWLDAIIAKLHANDSARRYQSAAEVAQVLGRHLTDRHRPAAEPPRRAVSRGAWRLWPPVAFVAAALGVLAVLGLLGTPKRARTADPSRTPATSQSKEIPATGRSADAAAKTCNFSDFTVVEVDQEFQTEITHGDQYRVSIAAPDDLLERVRVIKEGPRLEVDLEPVRQARHKQARPRLAIVMPALESLRLDHGARATLRGFSSQESFEAGVHYGATLEGSIEAKRIAIEATFGGEAALKGSADEARLTADFGGRLKLDRLEVRDADVRLDHGSSATVHPRETLEYSLDHTAKLKYLGRPAIGRAIQSEDSSVKPW
jgi:serine/threonine-protein kinase